MCAASWLWLFTHYVNIRSNESGVRPCGKRCISVGPRNELRQANGQLVIFKALSQAMSPGNSSTGMSRSLEYLSCPVFKQMVIGRIDIAPGSACMYQFAILLRCLYRDLKCASLYRHVAAPVMSLRSVRG